MNQWSWRMTLGLMGSHASLSALRLARLASAHPRLHLNTAPTAAHHPQPLRKRAMSAPTTAMSALHLSSSTGGGRFERTALLFAGQGAQTVGMTREQLAIPAVSRMYDVANEALGYDLKQIVLEGVLRCVALCKRAAFSSSLS